MEWLLSTFVVQHHALGTLKDAHTLWANPLRLSCPGTSLSSPHQASVSSYHACHFIHSAFYIGEGSSIEVVGGQPPLLCQPEASLLPLGTPEHEAVEGAGTQGLLSAWTNQIGHLASFHPLVGRLGSLTLVFLLGLLSDDEWEKVTHHLDEEGLSDWACLLAGFPWPDVTWGILV